jgi:hypothetical protein
LIDLGIDGIIKLKPILRKRDVWIWTGLRAFVNAAMNVRVPPNAIIS